MRYAFFSDIHGNMDALRAVLKAIEEDGGADKVLCVGDLVGYGAEPRECIAAIKELNCPVIAGNHDFAAAGRMQLDYFNALAREAIEWTTDQLEEEDKQFLWNLPLVWDEEESFVMVHGTLQDPSSFGYVLNDLDALLLFRDLKKDFCITGHSHYPCAFVYGQKLVFSREPELEVEEGQRAIINVGSVGQPRDGDPRACLVFFDDERRLVETRRIVYDVEEAARKIISAGLPEPLADRLLAGI
jgi:diadenosine tetraphosphatase ApaH/serine/threonine PP2A family protein phosphatase